MEPRADALARNWWATMLRGLVAIAFAIIVWAWPGHTLALLTVLLGAYLIGDGVVALAGTGGSTRRDERWLLTLEGILGIALGVFALARPVKAMAAIFLVIALWALCTGILEIIEAGRAQRFLPDEWLLALSGVVRVAFGILLLARPRAAVRTLLWIAAVYALIEGVTLVFFALRRRRIGEGPHRRAGGGMTPQPI